MTDELEKWKPYLIALFTISLCFNSIVCIRLYLYLSLNEKNANMTLINLIICSTILSAVFNYSSLALFFFDVSYDFLHIEDILKSMLWYIINEGNTPKIASSIKIVNCIIGFCLVSMFLLLQNLYTIESIKLLKNPISNFSLRGKIYKGALIICFFISFLVSYFVVNSNSNSPNEILIIWIIHPLVIFFGVYVIVQIFSFGIMINTLRKKSIISSFSNVKFALRHFSLMIITIAAEAYLFWLVFRLPTRENDATALVLLNGIGVIHSLIQIFEVECSCNCNKSIADEIDDVSDINVSDENQICASLVPQSKIVDNRISLTEELQSHYLIECFNYILEGIASISNNERNMLNKTAIVKEQHYKEQIVHSFCILNHQLTHLQSSEPHQSQWSLLDSLKIFSNTIQMIEYAPDIFKNIRKMDKIDSSVLKNSFDLVLNKANLLSLKGSEGKSGSLFLMTHDCKFLIKTISEKELNALINNFIQNYYNLLAENHNSLLSKIYGAFTLKMGGSIIYFVILENIAPYPTQSFLYRFDLKGSLQGRKTNKLLQNTKKTLKDLDYLDLDKDDTAAKIELTSYSQAIIRDTIREDIKVLQESNLMDYSLFIAVAKNTLVHSSEKYGQLTKKFTSKNKKYVYYIGIIDYLTEYDYMKNFETILLKLTHFTLQNTFSAVNSTLYRLRFYNFVSSILFNRNKSK